jgi:Trk K+ transport system NAD-binding subunit
MPDINREHLKSPNRIFTKEIILLGTAQTFSVPDSWAPAQNAKRLAATKQSGDDLTRQPSRKMGFAVAREQQRSAVAQAPEDSCKRYS